MHISLERLEVSIFQIFPMTGFDDLWCMAFRDTTNQHMTTLIALQRGMAYLHHVC